MGTLTAIKVKTTKEPGRYGDGDGLMLVVKPSGAKSWQLRVQSAGKRRDIGLGSASTTSLADARERASEVRKQIRSGIDPVEAKRTSVKKADTLITFEQVAVAFHDERKSSWRNLKHRAQWLSTLETYVFPYIGSLPIDAVTGPAIRDLMVPIWQAKAETARRVLQRIGAVLDWAHSKGLRPTDAPMRSIRAGLARQTTRPKHFAALPYPQVGNLLRQLADVDTSGRLALRLLIFTATRSGEVRNATWEEIDLQKALWTIPASRMKAKREHVVPLSNAAVAVLTIADGLRRGVPGEPIFPGLRGNALSDMTLAKVLRTAIGGDWTVHGFRSSFRDWAAECSAFPAEIAETALAHSPPNKVIGAYRRTDYLEKRRELMQEWSQFLGS